MCVCVCVCVCGGGGGGGGGNLFKWCHYIVRQDDTIYLQLSHIVVCHNYSPVILILYHSHFPPMGYNLTIIYFQYCTLVERYSYIIAGNLLLIVSNHMHTSS